MWPDVFTLSSLFWDYCFWTCTICKSLTQHYPFYLLQNILLPTIRQLKLPICQSPFFHVPTNRTVSIFIHSCLLSSGLQRSFQGQSLHLCFWFHPFAISLDFIPLISLFLLTLWPFLLYVTGDLSFECARSFINHRKNI